MTDTEAFRWLLLDNLRSGWGYTTNMPRADADAALRWATEKGYVRDGRLTTEGEMALLAKRLA